MTDACDRARVTADDADTGHQENVGVRAVLADGQVGLLRPLCPDDQDAVLRLYENLDERDRYFRFFGPLPPRLNDLVFGMTAPVDVRHGSMGAFLDQELIGVANYEVLADPIEAEVALTVSGTVQAHGVGTLLLDHATVEETHRLELPANRPVVEITQTFPVAGPGVDEDVAVETADIVFAANHYELRYVMEIK